MGFIQNKLDLYKKNKALKKLTYGFGKIIEDENTIYCYVDEKPFKSKFDYGNIYGFNLTHDFVTIDGTIYELKKDIVYIFDGIFFDKPLSFYISSRTHNYIKFQNCTFTKSISVYQTENVEFTNNKNISHITKFLVKKGVNNLKFINDNTLTSAVFSDSTYIDISCNTLEMYDTVFNSNSSKINVKNLIMKNSDICSYEKIEINADKIDLNNSEIYSSDEIKLNTKECTDFSSVRGDDITYNGLPLYEHNNSYDEIDKLVAARKSLVDTLVTIKLKEENYQKEEVSRYRKELKNSPLTRRLTKKNTYNH